MDFFSTVDLFDLLTDVLAFLIVLLNQETVLLQIIAASFILLKVKKSSYHERNDMHAYYTFFLLPLLHVAWCSREEKSYTFLFDSLALFAC